MATIVTRAGKGAPLTFAELDANFNNLNNAIAATYALDSGAANTYVATLSGATYVDGTSAFIKFVHANTGASTININSLGPKSIFRQDGSALQAGDIPANTVLEIVYNSTLSGFELVGSALGANLTTYTPSGTGAVTTNQASFNNMLPYSVFNTMTATQIADITSYTGSIDTSTAIQQAVTNCPGRLYFPPGRYQFGGISVTKPIQIEGSGPGALGTNAGTVIVPNTITANLFTFNAQNAFVVKDIGVRGIPQTAGSMFTVEYTTASSVANLGTLFDNIFFDSAFIGINFVSASSWSVRNCVFWNIPAGGIGVQVANTFNTDQGDSNVQGCTFSPAAFGSSAIGINYISGDGMRVVNNKFFVSQGLVGSLATTAGGGQMYIGWNSFDNVVTAAIALTNSGSFAFSSVEICNNQSFSYGAVSSMFSVIGIAGAHITDVNIHDNNLQIQGGSLANGMVFVNYIDRLSVKHNTMYNSGASGNGVQVGANCTDGEVMDNKPAIGSFATEINNSSAGVRTRGRRQSGHQSAGSGTSMTVSHNLGVTPTKFIVSPDGSNPGNYWVTAANTTQFVINWVTSGTANFSWEIEA